MTTTKGLHFERLALKLERGIPFSESANQSSLGIHQTALVVGRSLLLELDRTPKSSNPPFEYSGPSHSNAPQRSTPLTRGERVSVNMAHSMNSSLQDYIKQLETLIESLEPAKHVETRSVTISTKSSQAKSAPPPIDPPQAVSGKVQEEVVPEKSVSAAGHTLAAEVEQKPSAVAPVPDQSSSLSAATAVNPQAPAPGAAISTATASSPEMRTCEIGSNELDVLRLNAGIHAIVNSSEYADCLRRPELLRVIALEAEGLPKKLARTMSSMAEQKCKLEQAMSKLCQESWIASDPSIQALNRKIVECTPPGYTWKARCDAPIFVFINELLKNLIQAYLSQAHQGSTVWSFSHFIALLLRSSELKNMVEPLWIYNVCTHTHVALLIFDENSLSDSSAAQVIRLYTAVLVCLPDNALLWTFVASLVNDFATSDKVPEKDCLNLLNATLGVAKAFLAEAYPKAWPRFEEVVRNHIDQKLRCKAEDNDSRVHLVQLEEALASVQKPEAYKLSAREKQLTVD